jgi:threonine aldolase
MPYTRILCHEVAHVDTDECGAPEFFTGGAKVTAVRGENGKISADALKCEMHRGHGVHYPKPGALTLTQSTEWGTVYSPEEIRTLCKIAHEHHLAVHMDGARFANAVAALQTNSANSSFHHAIPADLTWKSGIDVLSFGGTKNGMSSAEAVVFFNRDLAKEFEYRVKQGGQLASKMRFAAAQWNAMLSDGAWLRHAKHANAMAQKLAAGLRTIPTIRLAVEPQVNGVFVELAPAVFESLTAKGWFFYPFIGEHGYRLMCSWATTDAEVDMFLGDLNEVISRS